MATFIDVKATGIPGQTFVNLDQIKCVMPWDNGKACVIVFGTDHRLGVDIPIDELAPVLFAKR